MVTKKISRFDEITVVSRLSTSVSVTDPNLLEVGELPEGTCATINLTNQRWELYDGLEELSGSCDRLGEALLAIESIVLHEIEVLHPDLGGYLDGRVAYCPVRFDDRLGTRGNRWWPLSVMDRVLTPILEARVLADGQRQLVMVGIDEKNHPIPSSALGWQTFWERLEWALATAPLLPWLATASPSLLQLLGQLQRWRTKGYRYVRQVEQGWQPIGLHMCGAYPLGSVHTLRLLAAAVDRKETLMER